MRIYFSIIIMLFAYQGFSQEIIGRAYYTSMIKSEKPELTEKQMENPQIRALAEQLDQAFTDDFILEFTQEESLFRKQPKLKKPNLKNEGITISRSLMGDDEIHYKNLQKSEYLNSKELYGKQFLIKDDIETPDWKLSKESKTIGDYVCFKATYVPKTKEADDSEESDEDAPRLRSGPDVKEIVAWYTPQIPIKNGPMEYDGLPGLILEVQDGSLKLLCTKIVLNPEEKIEITAPRKGKKVNQKEFKAIMKQKNAEMMENFKSRILRN